MARLCNDGMGVKARFHVPILECLGTRLVLTTFSMLCTTQYNSARFAEAENRAGQLSALPSDASDAIDAIDAIDTSAACRCWSGKLGAYVLRVPQFAAQF